MPPKRAGVLTRIRDAGRALKRAMTSGSEAWRARVWPSPPKARISRHTRQPSSASATRWTLRTGPRISALSGAVDEAGDVAGADGDGGRAGGVAGADHVGAAGGEDHGDGVVGHELAGGAEGGLVEAGDEAGRCAGALGGLGEDLGGAGAAASGAGMGGADDGVAGLDRGEDLEEDGGGGVGDRDDAGDDADGASDGGGASALVDQRTPTVRIESRASATTRVL